MYFGKNIVSTNCPSIDSPLSFLSGKPFMMSKSFVWLDSYYWVDMGGAITVSWNNKFLLCILVSLTYRGNATFIDQAFIALLLILNLGLEIQ